MPVLMVSPDVFFCRAILHLFNFFGGAFIGLLLPWPNHLIKYYLNFFLNTLVPNHLFLYISMSTHPPQHSISSTIKHYWSYRCLVEFSFELDRHFRSEIILEAFLHLIHLAWIICMTSSSLYKMDPRWFILATCRMSHLQFSPPEHY